MTYKGSKKWNMFKRVICLITIQLFLISNISFAVSDFSKEHNSKVEKSALAVDSLTIPRDYGTIKERSNGGNGKLVLYIQDAHCNYEAQTNIARILEYLIKNYKVDFVSVEGADGIVDTSWFKAFPDEDIKQEVADYFMKKGEITGAEFLSITSDYPFTIYGAENRKYYIDNLNSFLESYPYKEEFLKYYTSVKSALGKLKKYIYTKQLRRLDNKVIGHKDKKIKFADYIRYLDNTAKTQRINIKTYPNISILMEAIKFEKNIDFDIVNDERAVLIDELSKKLSKDNLSKLVNKSLAFKLGKIDGNTFYSYLAELAKEKNISITKKYEDFSRYIIYSRIYAKIDNEGLFDEIDELLVAIKENMFRNDDQRTLDKLCKDVNVALGFMNIELTNKEHEYYQENKNEFGPANFIIFINKQSERFGLSCNISTPDEELNNAFTKLIDFYEIALRRDKILVENMFKGMRGKKTDVAVLITGGFHTKGVTKFLKKEDASYVVISPAITKDTESPYIAVLTGQKTPFEELIIGGMGEMSQLQVASKFSSISMDKHIASGEVTEAGKRFYRDFAHNLIKSYISLFSDKTKEDIKKLLITNFRESSKLSPNRIGSRYILDVIERDFDTIYEEKTTPGTKMLGSGLTHHISIEQANTYDAIIKQSFYEGKYEIIQINVDDTLIDACIHYGLEERIKAHNERAAKKGGVIIPEGLEVHPGRGGEEFKHQLAQFHMSGLKYFFFSEDEIAIIARHEKAHIDIENGVQKLRDEHIIEEVKDLLVITEATLGTLASLINPTCVEYIKALKAKPDLNEEHFVESLPGRETHASGIRDKFKRLEQLRKESVKALAQFEKEDLKASLHEKLSAEEKHRILERLNSITHIDERFEFGGNRANNLFRRISEEAQNREIRNFAKDYLAHRTMLDYVTKTRQISSSEDGGFDIYIFVSTSATEAMYWQWRFEVTRGQILPKNAIILSVYTEGPGRWHGKTDNGSASLYAFKLADKLLQERFEQDEKFQELVINKYGRKVSLVDILREEWSVMMMLMAGSGKRMQPMAANNKSSISLPDTVVVDGKIIPVTIGEAVARTFGPLAETRGGRLTEIWGDQINLPGKNIDSDNRYAIEIFNTITRFETEDERNYAVLKGVLLSTGEERDVLLREKPPVQEIEKHARVLDGVYVADLSLGFNSYRWEFLQALLDMYRQELRDERGYFNIDSDLWTPLSFENAEEYADFMWEKRVANFRKTVDTETFEELTTDTAENDQKDIERKWWERIHNMLEAFIAKHGEQYRISNGRTGVLGRVDYGLMKDSTDWWDFGQIQNYYDSLMKALFESHDIDKRRDVWSAERIRRYFGIRGRDDWIRDSYTGAAEIVSSIVIGCNIAKGNIKNSILIDVSAEEINVENAIVIGTTVIKLEGKSGIVQNVVSEKPISFVEGDALVSHYFPGQGQKIFKINWLLDNKNDPNYYNPDTNYDSIMFDNPVTFGQLSDMLKRHTKTEQEAEKAIISAPIRSRNEKLITTIIDREAYLRNKFAPLQFGTSGLRALAIDMSDMECYINTVGFIAYLKEIGEINSNNHTQNTISLAGDLRSSTNRVLKAVVRAIKDSGFQVDYCGKIPTPTLAYYAGQKDRPSIMVTGSHIPSDRQGIKFYKKSGEVLKADEAGILENVANARRQEYFTTWRSSLFNEEGMFKSKQPSLGPVNGEAKNVYIQRYIDAFPPGCLSDITIALYQHSAVGRDIMQEIFQHLGATVIPAERSKTFIPVDSEAITPETRAILKGLAEEHKPFAVISADGDTDRPLFADENGQFLPGDKLGLLTVLALDTMGVKVNFAAIPISANDAVFQVLEEKGVETAKTKIGSPYVIKAMNDRVAKGDKDKTVSWEVNGGFLTASELEIVAGKPLKALPTRDAMLPLISALILAKGKGSVSELIATLPSRYTHAGLLDNFPREIGQKIIESIVPEDKNIARVDFVKQDVKVTYSYGRVKTLNAKDPLAVSMIQTRARLSERYFTPALGFDAIVAIEFVDGIRIIFANNDVSHLRPSGNADQFRNYATANTQGRAEEIVKITLAEVLPKMGTAIDEAKSKDTPEEPTFDGTPGTNAIRTDDAKSFNMEEFIRGILQKTGTISEKIATDQREQENLRAYITVQYSQFIGKTIGQLTETDLTFIDSIYRIVLSRVQELRIQSRVPAQEAFVRFLRSLGLRGISVDRKTAALRFDEKVPVAASYIDRGQHDSTYMLLRRVLPEKAIAMLSLFKRHMFRTVYNMGHFGRLHAITSFDQENPLYPGTIVYQTTGVHSQAKAFDFKLVREGYGIQLISWYDKTGKLHVRAMYLKPGVWAFSIPGTEDTVVNLGGLKFSDRSFEVSERTAQKITSQLGITQDQILDTKFNENLPGFGMPYIVYMENGKPYLAMHLETQGKVGAVGIEAWIQPFVPTEEGIDVIFNPAKIDEYEATVRSKIETDEFAERIIGQILARKPVIDTEVPETLREVNDYSKFEATNEKAKEFFTRLDEEIQAGRPINFKPNVRAGVSTAKEGYTWGKLVTRVESFILKSLGISNKEDAVRAGIMREEEDVVSERWIASADNEFPSMINVGTEYSAPMQVLLGNYPEEVFGTKQLAAETAPKLGVVAKLLDAGRSLSAQVHLPEGDRNSKPEMWIALAPKARAVMGFSKDLTRDQLKERLEQGDISILHLVEMKEGQPYDIRGGLAHALGAGVEIEGQMEGGYVYEVSMEPEDMSKATQSFIDRKIFPDEAQKQPRIGKDFSTMTEQQKEGVLDVLETSGMLRQVRLEDYEVTVLEPIQQIRKSKLELMLAKPGFVVERFTIELGDRLQSEALTSGRVHSIFVEKGEVRLVSARTDETIELKAGEERLIPANLGEYELVSTTEPATVYMQYKPLEGETRVITGFETMFSPINKARFEGIQRRERKPIMLHVPSTMHANNSFKAEKEALRLASDNTVHMTKYGRTIDSLRGKALDPNYTHVFITYRDDLERIENDKSLGDALENVLTQRIIPIARPKDETKGVAFAREIESAAVTLGNTEINEIEEGIGNAVYLQRIMNQLVGKEISLDALKSLMGIAEYDFGQAVNRIAVLIKALLISRPIEQYDADKELRNRRQLLWSL